MMNLFSALASRVIIPITLLVVACSDDPASRLRGDAEKGNADAQYDLGVMHDRGEGVRKDAVEAIRWYQKAAQQGHASAQFILGSRYASGEGIDRDPSQAVHWYTRVGRARSCLGSKSAYGSGC